VAVPVLVFIFIASHAIGQGAVIWVFISEIFPNSVRSYGNSLGSSTHWIFAALIAGNFVYFESIFGGGPIFAFFRFHDGTSIIICLEDNAREQGNIT
jgi:MFS transporter, SP family, arabinose:H+ symporter